ncbi:hypothetical protein TRFO_36674 [Tritrichomonas foetus]|uniref:Uncharacterized protein n=1 Tax=Tritrichomonas foetus TaxID=1144522 RepID=A0A1J4JHT9_9EUKA|nr:hypothetical protein TRFO_36674 [Tritrichomonas foetus]|eukprot:OHS97179.1 hypothetical protein TRFO_36674 [Tritrichomonas foetus]
MDFDRTTTTIGDELKAQLSHFDFEDKLESAVTDCASVMIKTINNLNFQLSPCLAHIVHSAIKKFLMQIPALELAMKNANILHNDYRFKQYLLTANYRKSNVQTYVDTRWLSRANTCTDIVNYYKVVKQYETLMNRLVQLRFDTDNVKIDPYVLPITYNDYQICISLNSVLEKIRKSILKIETRNNNGIFLPHPQQIKNIYALDEISMSLTHGTIQSNPWKVVFSNIEDILKFLFQNYINWL